MIKVMQDFFLHSPCLISSCLVLSTQTKESCHKLKIGLLSLITKWLSVRMSGLSCFQRKRSRVSILYGFFPNKLLLSKVFQPQIVAAHIY